MQGIRQVTVDTAAVPTPPAGSVYLFVDTTDGLFKCKDANARVTAMPKGATVVIGSMTVAHGQYTIPHGLGAKPKIVQLYQNTSQMLTGYNLSADDTNLYITMDADVALIVAECLAY